MKKKFIGVGAVSILGLGALMLGGCKGTNSVPVPKDPPQPVIMADNNTDNKTTREVKVPVPIEDIEKTYNDESEATKVNDTNTPSSPMVVKPDDSVKYSGVVVKPDENVGAKGDVIKPDSSVKYL